MKFLRRAVFYDTTVVEASTFEEALELFKDEDYCFPGKPEYKNYFVFDEDKVAYGQDSAGNWYVHPVKDVERVLFYTGSADQAHDLCTIVNRNSGVPLKVPDGQY